MKDTEVWKSRMIIVIGFKKIVFLMWTIFKVFIAFVTILFLFWFFGRRLVQS